MLLSAVNIAGSVCQDSVYVPWNVVLPEGYDAVVDLLKKAYDVVVVAERMFGTPLKDGSVWLVSVFCCGRVLGSARCEDLQYCRSRRGGILAPVRSRPANAQHEL